MVKKFSWVIPKHDSCIAPPDIWSNKGTRRNV